MTAEKRETVWKHVAALARLPRSADAHGEAPAEWEALTALVRRIESADDGTEDDRTPPTVWREDEPTEGWPRETLLRNAPATADGYVVVPRAVE